MAEHVAHAVIVGAFVKNARPVGIRAFSGFFEAKARISSPRADAIRISLKTP